MLKAALIVIVLMLCGCDKIDAAEKQIADLEKRMKASEDVIQVVKTNLGALQFANYQQASSFNGCVLQHMQGVQSDLAAESIKESCLQQVSIQIGDISALLKSTAAYGQIYGYPGQHYGMYVYVDNQTGYTITEMTISVKDKKTNESKTYLINTFQTPLDPGTFISALPKDKTVMMKLPPGQHAFTVETVGLPVTDANKFRDAYDWYFVSAKGFVN